MGESWQSWSGRVSCAPARFAQPRDEAELQLEVSAAWDRGHAVRVVGTGHSFSPSVATDGLLLNLDADQGVVATDTDACRARVRAGSKISALGEPLLAAGLALHNQGDVDVQSVGGALGTGTHGTGPTLRNLSCALDGVRVVTPDGSLVDWNARDHPEEIAAVRVSQGMLGVMSEVTLQLRPAYRLHERNWRAPIAECLDELDARIAATRHFEFFWYPSLDACEMKALDETEAPVDPMPDRKGEYVDWSWRVFPSERTQKFNEMEYSVPLAEGPLCFARVRERMLERHPEVVWPVEYRTLGADDVWLSQAYGRDSVTISIHEDARRPCEPVFRDLESIFLEHEGRPHWGKVHFATAEQLAPHFPRWNDFVNLRRKLDPDGRFLSEHLRERFS